MPDLKYFLEVITNIFKKPLLCSVLTASIIISSVLPSYSTFFILPQFANQLLKSTEENAQRAASYLTARLFQFKKIDDDFSLSLNNIRELEAAQKLFKLEKIKLFSQDGEIVYSSNYSEIGTINKNDYFFNIVAGGNKYSKIVRKNEQTLEGKVTDIDVAEVYIPIVESNTFYGAFEMYYNITVHKKELDSLLQRSAFVLYSLATTFFLFVLVMLFYVSRSIVQREKAELELQSSNVKLEKEITQKKIELLATQKTSIKALAILAEYYDPDTGEHLARIQSYVEILVNSLKENSPYSTFINKRPDYAEEVVLASLLHDIGKTAIPREILQKPAKLSQQEFDIVKKHTTIAGEVLNKANKTFSDYFHKESYLVVARDIALFHHERWNGQGYPFQLKEDHIPLSARIVALADVYDSLCCKRPYKEPFSHDFTVKEITREKEKHFDPHIVDAFLVNSDKFYAISSSYSCCKVTDSKRQHIAL